MNTYAVHTTDGEVLEVRFSACGPTDQGIVREMDRLAALACARLAGEHPTSQQPIAVLWSAAAGIQDPAKFVRPGDRHPWDDQGEPAPHVLPGTVLPGTLHSIDRRMDRLVVEVDQRDMMSLAGPMLTGRRVVLTILPEEEF